ncbi:MAG: hypothetical protein LBC21_03420, partial [Oscillospiraceae bacterium]|nr:hypothetical protein [Oscillospiraceae bacterium]
DLVKRENAGTDSNGGGQRLSLGEMSPGDIEELDTAMALEPDYRELRRHLRTTPIAFGAHEKGAGDDYGFDTYNDMRKRYWGKLKLVAQGKGTPPDLAYQDLQASFGKGFFPDGIDHPLERWRRILDVVDEAYANKEIIDSAAKRARELREEMRNMPNSSEALDDEYVADRLAMLAGLRELGEELDRDVRANRDLTRQGEAYERRLARLRESAQKRLQAERGRQKERSAAAKAKSDRKVLEIKYAHMWKGLLDKRKRQDTAKRGKIRKTIKELDALLRHPTDAKHVPEHLRAAVAGFLSTLDFDGGKAMSDAGRARVDDLRRTYKEIADSGDTALYFGPEMSDKLDAVAEAMKEKPLNKLGSAELGDLLDVARSVLASVKNYNRMFREGGDLTVSAFAGEAMSYNYAKRPHELSKLGLGQALGEFFNADLVDSFTMFEEMGPAMNALFRDLRAGFDVKVRDVVWAQDALGEALEGVDNKARKAWRDVAKEFKTESGAAVKLTGAQLMSLYVQSRQQQALEHYYGGGITVVPKIVKGEGGKRIEQVTHRPARLAPGDLARFMEALDDQQKDVADKLAALFIQTAEWGNEVSMRLYGYRKFTEESYFPIVSDRNFLSDTYDGLGATQQLADLGITKSRVKGANNAVVVEDIFTVAARQLDQMSSYHAFVVPLADAGRVINYRKLDVSVKSALENSLGKRAVEYVNKFLRDVNGGGRADSGGLYGKIVRRAKAAALGANMRVVLQQPTSILRAASMLDPKWLARGLAPVRGAKGDMKTVARYSPIAAWRGMGFYSLDTGRQMEDIIMGKHSVSEKAMWGIGKADELTWRVIWNAVGHETAAKDKGLRPGSKEFYEAAGRRFDDIIDRTQVVDTVFHRAQIMRSDNANVKAATAFMSEGVKTYNILRSAVLGAGAPGGKRKVARAFAAVLASLLAGSLVRSAWDAWRDKEEKEGEEAPQKFLRHLFGTKEKAFLDGDLVPSAFGMLPYARDLVSLFQGYGLNSMDGEGVERAYTSVVSLVKSLVKGEESKMTPLYYTKQAAGAVAALFGLPVKNALREMEDLSRHALRWTGKPLLEYQAKRFLYSVNDSPGVFYDILFGVSPYGKRPDAEAYEEISAAMLRDGREITQERIDTAMRNRVLDKSLVKSEIERSNAALVSGASAFEAYKLLTPEMVEALDGDIAEAARGLALDSNSDFEPGGKAAEAIRAREAGVPEAAYLLYAQVRQLFDEPEGESGHGTYSNSEIADAIDAMEGLTDEQKSALWTLHDADGLHAKLRGAGLDAAPANAMAAAVARLVPPKGHEQATTAQKYEAVLRGGYTAAERDKAMDVLMTQMNENGEKPAYKKYKSAMKAGLSVNTYLEFRENQTALDNFLEYKANGASRAGAERMARAIMGLKKLDGRDDIQALQKYAAIVESGAALEDQIAAFKSHMDDSEFYKIEAVSGYGVTPGIWVQYKGNIYDIDANGSVDQSEAEAAIRAIPGLNASQRAALWQMQNRSWSPGNNPFGNSRALRAVLDGAPKQETVRGTNPVTGRRSA